MLGVRLARTPERAPARAPQIESRQALQLAAASRCVLHGPLYLHEVLKVIHRHAHDTPGEAVASIGAEGSAVSIGLGLRPHTWSIWASWEKLRRSWN